MGPQVETYPSAACHVAGTRGTDAANEPLPIWLAVLLATSCEARSHTRNHTIRWDHNSGRAMYTNAGKEDESIEPLGVRLSGGKTLAVSWGPGETSYTLEVFERTGQCTID